MTIIEYKKEIQNLLGKDLIQEVIDTLGDGLRKGTNLYEDVVMISARYYRIKRERRNETISNDAYDLGLNKVIGSLISLLEEGKESDFNDSLVISTRIQEKSAEHVQELRTTVKQYAGIKVEYGLLKTELALVIDISHPMYGHVLKHFEGNKRVTLVHITSKYEQRKLDADNRKEWEDIARGVSQFLMFVSQVNPPEKLHIFLAAPSALGLTIGCTLRNLLKPYIYHFDRDSGEYRLIAVANDSLRE